MRRAWRNMHRPASRLPPRAWVSCSTASRPCGARGPPCWTSVTWPTAPTTRTWTCAGNSRRRIFWRRRWCCTRWGVPAARLPPPFFPLPGWPRRFTQTIPRVATVARELDASLAVVHTPFFAHEHSPRAERYSAGLRLGRLAGGGKVEIPPESHQNNKPSQRSYLEDLHNIPTFPTPPRPILTVGTRPPTPNGQTL